MRVDPNYRIAETYNADDHAGAKKTGSSCDQRGDSATLSLNPEVQSLSNAVITVSDVRESRVAALAKSLADGTYQVTPEQTAEALLQQMLTRTR